MKARLHEGILTKSLHPQAPSLAGETEWTIMKHVKN